MENRNLQKYTYYKMTYRYIYKITCTNGSFKDKFYYGQRTTDIEPYKDEYKGSGKKLIDYYPTNLIHFEYSHY